MSDPLNPLAVLLELDNAGSLAVAASRVGKTPSAVSKLIRTLERQLGHPLVEHASRPLRLTEAGRAYLEAARAIKLQLRETEEQVRIARRDPGGRLRVTASLLFGHAVLADYVVEYRRAWPQVRLEVVLCDDYVDLHREDIDLAIRHGEQAGANLIARPIGSNAVWLCGTPAYFAAMGRPQVPEDLHLHRCLNFRCDALDSRWRFRQGERCITVAPQPSLVCNSDEFLMASMLAGDGLLPCFEWSISGSLRAGVVQPCLTDWQFDSDAFGDPQLWAVYPRGHRGNAKVRHFVEGLAARLAERRLTLTGTRA